MNEPFKYIAKVEIKNLWFKYDLEWNLDPEVNILSGINGSGKSTILECIINLTNLLTPNYAVLVNHYLDKTTLCFNNNFQIDAVREIEKDVKFKQTYTNGEQGRKQLFEEWRSKNIIFDTIRTFDNALYQNTSPDFKVKTDLDERLYRLQIRYLDYQLNIGKRAFEIVSKNLDNSHDEVLLIKKQHERFIEIINLLFKETGKKVETESNELYFFNGFQGLEPYVLSSGEKQILIILLTVLLQDNKPSILFMDEPEVSLHIDWQKKLIQYIRELNPNVQVIIATHSPGIIMEGWADKVFEMSDLLIPINKEDSEYVK
jgi:energy-coupling factor transporter ATP-binding protein EcfA2